jgi:hypothetical protein
MNCELVIFCQICCIVKFDMFTDRILDFDRYRCIFRTNLLFPMFPPISFPFSELPFSILFPIKKCENGNGFSVYRPFSSQPITT